MMGQRKSEGSRLLVALSCKATWEAEIRRIAVQDQPRQIVLETPHISKIARA
jgi:hypothetical protein